MAYYYITQIQDIVFYGVNDNSLRMKEYALSIGKNVIAFIDRNAKIIGDVDGIPVYDEFASVDSNTCLIIALQNALQHDGIAKSANKYGFKRILYIPMDFAIESHKTQIMRSAYNSILLNDWGAEKGPIADYHELYKNTKCSNTFGEELRDKKYRIVRIPAELVYTSLDDKGYADVPLIAFKPYEILFNYFENREETAIPNSYLERNAQKNIVGDNDFEKTLTLRYECIEKYTEFFQDGLDFAISCAPLGKLNSRGYFNLCEGHHRTMWLLRSGIYYLPLRISVDDYARFINQEQVKVINRDARFHDIKQQTIISNPMFNRVSFYNKFSLIKLMLKIQRCCFNVVKGKKIYVYDSFWGCFAFDFYRMRADKVTYYIQNEVDLPYVGKIEDLYRSRLSYSYDSYYGDDDDVVVFLGEISGVDKLKIIERAQREHKIVISNISTNEKDSIKKEYTKAYTYIGGLFFNNRIESVYVLSPE